MKMLIHEERRKEISNYMTTHNWVADYNPTSNLWAMGKESHAYSSGPIEVMAMGTTLEEAFDKAIRQQKSIEEKQIDRSVENDIAANQERRKKKTL